MGCLDETTALAFARGEPSDGEAQAIAAHIDTCPECLMLVALAASGDPRNDVGAHARLQRGRTVDRFVVLELVGRGAMGDVYAAYDPGLNRKVALKFLNAEVGRRGDPHARLLREARAMATLSHRNVVAVHDLGVFDEHPYVAMEFIEGSTLRGWLEARARSVAEVQSVFRDAAAGLAAAHAEGLVHRDFKPDNVLIGDDGRVCVTDFGLVAGVSRRPVADDLVVVPKTLDATQTRTGALVGTPAYMAPEQLRGEAADARSDQFSFCVSLWEALTGSRPYSGRSVEALLDSIRRGGLDPHGMPRWLVPTLLRGLAPDPAKRHPSMEALGGRLQRGRGHLRWVAGAVAVVAVSSWALRADEVVSPECGDAAAGDLTGIWDDDRRSSLTAAFAAADVPFAVEVQPELYRAVDAYTDRWSAARTRLCVAQPGEPHAAGMACLERRILELNALLDVVERGDPGSIERALPAVLRLPALETCLDPRLDLPEPLDDPANANAVAEIRRRLTEVSALLRAGVFADALPLAKTLAREAAALEYRPLQAEATRLLGRTLNGSQQRAQAEATLEEALWLAQGAGHTREQFLAALDLVSLVGAEEGRTADGIRWSRYAESHLLQSGATPREHAALANARGAVWLAAERYDDAEPEFVHALELLGEAGLGETYSFVVALDHLGAVAGARGELAVAIDHHRRAFAMATRLFGAQHPLTLSSLNNHALALSHAGKLEDAVAMYERVLAARERAYGPVHPRIGETVSNLGATEVRRGRYPAAEMHFRRAAAIFGATMPGHSRRAEALLNLAGSLLEQERIDEAERTYEEGIELLGAGGRPSLLASTVAGYAALLTKRGDHVAAVEAYRRALKIREDELGPDHPDVGRTLSNLGTVLVAAGDLPAARSALRRALRIREAKLGPMHPALIFTLAQTARLHVLDGDTSGAVRLLERAVSISEGSEARGPARASVEFALAKALLLDGKDRQRARDLAHAARKRADAELVEEIDAWLAGMDGG
ncbi:MAG: serine/threonine-protein kinase [Myxococcota bacterium]